MPYVDRSALPFDQRLPKRFWDKVEFTADGCWIWTGSASQFEYGHLRHDSVYWLAHRFSYTKMVGKILSTSIDHLCRVHSCVNPAHLEDLPIGANVKRGLGLPAINARKKACMRGHPLIGHNLMWTRSNKIPSRHCRECHNERRRKNKRFMF